MASSQTPYVDQASKKYSGEMEDFLGSGDLRVVKSATAAYPPRLDTANRVSNSNFVANFVYAHFPHVAERLREKDPGTRDPTHPLRNRFGLFPLFAVNLAMEGGSGVETKAHLDGKNLAGCVCVVLAGGAPRGHARAGE